jgi:hypothetical protein
MPTILLLSRENSGTGGLGCLAISLAVVAVVGKDGVIGLVGVEIGVGVGVVVGVG